VAQVHVTEIPAEFRGRVPGRCSADESYDHQF